METIPATVLEIDQRSAALQQEVVQARARLVQLDSQVAAASTPDLLVEAQQISAKIESCLRALEHLTQQRLLAVEAAHLSKLENHLKENRRLQRLGIRAAQKVAAAENEIEPLRVALKHLNQQLNNRSWDTEALISELRRQGIKADQIAALQARYHA